MIIKFNNFKLLLEQNNNLDNIFELTFYNVTFHTNDSSDNLYHGIDYEKALYNYERENIPDGYENRNDLVVEFDKRINKYKFIHILDEEYETIEDYPIEDYYKDETVYELIEEGDPETIDNKTIEPLNKKTDVILNTVQIYYHKKYGSYKYNKINIEDKDDHYLGCINLRISNHTENIFNVDRFGGSDYHISVVISNFDPTAKRFGMTNAFERRRNEFEFKYN